MTWGDENACTGLKWGIWRKKWGIWRRKWGIWRKKWLRFPRALFRNWDGLSTLDGSRHTWALLALAIAVLIAARQDSSSLASSAARVSAARRSWSLSKATEKCRQGTDLPILVCICILVICSAYYVCLYLHVKAAVTRKELLFGVRVSKA